MLLDEKISEEEYNKLPGIRSTALKYFIKFGARAYYQKYVLDVFEPEKEKDCYKGGKLFHAWVLEDRKDWMDPPYPADESKQKKAWKEYKKEAEDRGLYAIDESQVRELSLMRQSFFDNQFASEALKHTARREQTIQFTMFGMPCKVRLDMWLENDSIADLKTARNPTPEKFFYQLNDLGYHYSAAFYELAVQSHLESEQEIPFYLITVENAEPFRCAVHTMHEDVRYAARRDVLAALQSLAECYATNEWPEPLAKEIHEYTPGMKWAADNNMIEGA